jgi:hypothetical protein
MFGYNPTVNDQSGQIIGEGVVGAAQTTANAQMKMADDIGSSLVSLAGAYGEMESRKAKGRAFKKTMDVMGPSLGMTTDKLKAAFGDVKTDMDYANLSDSLMPILPSWVNATLGYGRLGIQQGAPLLNAGLKGATLVAGGEGTVPLPVEPPLPAPTGASPQSSQPSPDVMSAASNWYNQSKGNAGMIPTGAKRPFYRTN